MAGHDVFVKIYVKKERSEDELECEIEWIENCI